MSRDLEFEVRGLPVAQGNVKAFVRGNRAIVTTGVKAGAPLGAWRADIAKEARDAIGDEPAIQTPVEVRATFWMPRPASHYWPISRRRSTRELRDDAPRWSAKKPDVDKLARALLDAITNVVIADDAQVVHLTVSKQYEDPHAVGVTVRLNEATW